MMKLILASNNKNKLREFREMADSLGIEIISQSEAGYILDVDETGMTFEENAYLKAAAVTKVSGLPAIADDSGLAVDALNGEPGIYSARYGLGHEASDTARNEYLMHNLGDASNRSARYVAAICCTFPNGDILTTRGECEGDILYAPQGHGGFGYDPIFRPSGFDRSMAELTPDEKNAISHRGKALREMAEKLAAYKQI